MRHCRREQRAGAAAMRAERGQGGEQPGHVRYEAVQSRATMRALAGMAWLQAAGLRTSLRRRGGGRRSARPAGIINYGETQRAQPWRRRARAVQEAVT